MSGELKKWQTPDKGSSEEKGIIKILKAFSSCLRKIPLYPATHPMVKDSILELFLSLDAFLKNYGDFKLEVLGGDILICEERLNDLQSTARDLISDLKKIYVEGITVSGGLTDVELENFLKILALKPEIMKEKGGMNFLINAAQIKNINLIEVHYARIKEGEEVTEKGQDSGVGSGSEEGTGAGAVEKGKEKDIVGMVSEFLSGSSEEVPDKEAIKYEFKKHSRTIVKQLLKLVGPEKAVEEVLNIIEERFDKAGFSEEEKKIYVQKVKEHTLTIKAPKVSKKDMEKQLAELMQENKKLKSQMKSSGAGVSVQNPGAEVMAESTDSMKKKVPEKDIVGMVSDFFSGDLDKMPDKETIQYEFRKNAPKVVKQLLKLIGPEKAVDEVLHIIEERFDKAGFSIEEKEAYVSQIKEHTIRINAPMVLQAELEGKITVLEQENRELKNNLKDLESTTRHAAETTQVLEQENKKIKKEKQRINSVLRHVAEGLVIVDNEGKVLVLNPAAEDLLEVDKEDKIGKHILEGLKDSQMVSMSRDKQQEIEIELAGPDDKTKKTLRASNAVIENEEGETVGIVSVLSDITKEKELDRMKSTFVSNVTHDLRAPLISIQKSLSIILEEAKNNIPAEQRQFLEIASNNAARLTTMVNDLLDISKLESGHMKPSYTHGKIDDVIQGVFNMLGAWAGGRNIELKKEGVDSLEIDADMKMLEQALSNLVGNAIKFTPDKGCVSVCVEDQGQTLKISVKDTGCGIPEDSLTRIFDKFEQAKTVPAAGGTKGTGLGLAIVKDIIELHSGHIWVESEIGRGSCFIFTMPKEKEVLDIRD
ncbi:MAG: ATP-binding protein [Candidatus Omnitrophota bacterium]